MKPKRNKLPTFTLVTNDGSDIPKWEHTTKNYKFKKWTAKTVIHIHPDLLNRK